MDDYQSKKGISTLVDMPQENIVTSADAIQESEETVDSQETISDYELYSNQKPEITAVEKRRDISASFQGKLNTLESIYSSEYHESNACYSDSKYLKNLV